MTHKMVQLPLVATPSAARLARETATHTMQQWRLAHRAEDVALVVSELVTNAVRAAGLTDETPSWKLEQRHMIELRIRREENAVLLEVYDRLPGVPEKREELDPFQEHGRGLWMVEELTERWGWWPCGRGKVVWGQFKR